MASDKKLTRYTSAVTIVTADVMNSLYGGEYGYNDSVGVFHPLVFGHIHDGTHEDGHASKILLTNGAHVRGYLANANLGGTDGTTPAVRYSNIMCYSDATYGSPAARRAAAAAGGHDLEILAIPEFVENADGSRCYYLDLSNSAGGTDGSVQFNQAGSFAGNNDLFYDYTNLRFGAGTSAPQRKAHIVDNTNPPLRIEGVTAGAGSVLVVDGSGDVYSDASIGSDQNLFESIALTGSTSGDTAIDATVVDDTLTLTGGTGISLTGNAAGQSVEVNNTQQAFQTITRNQTGTGTSSGADVVADTVNDTLIIEAGNNIDVTLDPGNDKVTISANVQAAEDKFYSQWLEAGNWVPYNGITGRAPKYTQITGSGNRNITYKYVADNSDPASFFSTTVCAPVDGRLTGGNTTSTYGSHNTSLPNYRDPIPSFLPSAGPINTPSSCRITAYFILDKSHVVQGAGGTATFDIEASFGASNATAAANITSISDAGLLQDAYWNTLHSSGDALTNSHSYPISGPNIPNGTVVVSDFSPLKLDLADIKDGLASFSLKVSNIGGTWFAELNGDNRHMAFRLIGARLLWIWE